jgi:hypothetical protein
VYQIERQKMERESKTFFYDIVNLCCWFALVAVFVAASRILSEVELRPTLAVLIVVFDCAFFANT